MKMRLYPRMAAQNIVRHRRFYYPFILALVGTIAAFYIVAAIGMDPGMYQLHGANYAVIFAQIGVFVLAFFCTIFLFYTNSFLMKQRNAEIGLYNVLGMEKRHISTILTLEMLIVWAVGMVAGLILGIVFHKLVALGLCSAMRLDVPFGFGICLRAIASSLVLFSGILLLILLYNLRAVGKARPIELLHAADAGEREPRTRWLLALLGIVCLGGGYAIALWSPDAYSALGLYFVAVILVIIGTYCLFSAVSIAVLKMLRRSRWYYKKPQRFINVSGMLYRMKQNAVGLANICILSTMVLVMISGTVSLYLGVEDAVAATQPYDCRVTTYDDVVSAQDPAMDAALDAQMMQLARDTFEKEGLSVEDLFMRRYLNANVSVLPDGNVYLDYHENGENCSMYWMTAEEYAQGTRSEPVHLMADEALIFAQDDIWQNVDALTLTDSEGGTLRLTCAAKTGSLDAWQAQEGQTAGYGFDSRVIVVVSDEQVLSKICAMRQKNTENTKETQLARILFADVQGDAKAQQRALDNLQLEIYETFESIDTCIISSRAALYEEMIGMAGGFLFLGVFLGLVFIMAAVLIVYYKQICEGYQDRRRFCIMQQVGLQRRQIRACINAQMLTVFFLPLGVSIVHIAFDLRLMNQLLTLFSLNNTSLTFVCSAATLAVFALLYAVVYLVTARTYNKIVSQDIRA